MGRKCLGCIHKDRTKLDAAIVEGSHSLRVIGEQFGISKGNVVNHRKHIDAVEMKMAQSGRSTEIDKILKRVDRLIKLFERHLALHPRKALPVDWVREMKEQRAMLEFRSKLMGRIAPAEDSEKREGDRYVVSFVRPDGEPVRIPMKVYASLPKQAFEADDDDGGALETKSKVPSEVVQELSS